MNFVLHHHLAARDLGSPAAGAGAMLPDLWRMADRRVRASAGAAIAIDGDVVLAGVAHHLALDRWFHADPVFIEGERAATDLLRTAEIRAPRTVLFAHVLWELCLDGALLRSIGFDGAIASVRAGIDHVRGGAGARAAERHHFGRVARSEGDRESFERRMTRIYDEIARGPWVEGYQSGAGVAARIQGVRAGIGLAPMDAADLARLATVADRLLDRAPESVARIVEAKPGSIAATDER